MKQILFIALTLFTTTVYSQVDSLKNASVIWQSTRNQKVGQGFQIGFIGSSDDTCQINTKLQIVPNSGIGRYLKSDANGFATWTPLVFSNGLTQIGDTTKYGGSIDLETQITYWSGDTLKYTDIISNLADDLIAKEWRFDDVQNGRNAVINLLHSQVYGLFAAEMSVFDTVANAGSGINVSNAGSGTKFILSSNVANIAYGAESWTDREEVNFYITDNSVNQNIGRIDLHCDSLLTSGSEWISQYIVDLETYSGTPNHGIQQIYMDSASIRLQYKASHGSYVYADTTAPTSVEIDESFKIIKPQSAGTVFWVDKDGKTTATDLAVVDGTEGNGKVLTSDASGNATWQSPDSTIVSGAASLNLIATKRTVNYSFSGTTTTWTLPAVASNTGVHIYIKNRGSGAITLNSNAGGNDIYNTSAANSLTINAGEAYILINDGTYWTVN